jgi:hypothetical protein
MALHAPATHRALDLYEPLPLLLVTDAVRTSVRIFLRDEQATHAQRQPSRGGRMEAGDAGG